MSRIKSKLTTIAGVGLGLAASAAAAVGKVIAPETKAPDAAAPPKHPRKRRQSKVRRVLAWGRGETYRQPSQVRERARRVRQIARGWHTVWTPPVPIEPIPEPEPKPKRKPRSVAVKARVLIDAGEAAEQAARDRDDAERAERLKAETLATPVKSVRKLRAPRKPKVEKTDG